jgi:hypothetical protein
MQNITLDYKPITSLGYVECNVPDDIMSLVRDEIEGMIKCKFKDIIPFNDYLAGAIEHEYRLKNNTAIFNKFFKKIIPEYWRLQGDTKEAEAKYVIASHSNGLADMWVNLQQKGEYNPIHHHSGVLSFVIWVNIPYSLEEEKNLPCNINSNTTCIGPSFTFVYSGFNRHVDNLNIPVDKSYEGKMIIFPSWLQHMVSPFSTSNDYRISVSGNLVVDNG